jgi:phage terminase large subunit
MSEIEYRWEYTKCYAELQKHKQDGIVILTGGAGSGKSYSVMQDLILEFCTERDKSYLVTRKTLPALRQTAYKWILDLMKEVGVYKYFEHNKSDRILTYRGNYMLFTGLDDPEKIKSSNFNKIWVEEATEFTLEDFIQLNLRKRSPTGSSGYVNQIILSHNPTDEYGYINQELVLKRGIVPIRSTYKDNPFLPPDYVRELEALSEQNPEYWKIYGLGEYAQLSNVIFAPWVILTEYPEHFDEVIYGVDFGYNNETAVIKVGILDNEIYLTELLYESHLTNSDLIARLRELDISPGDYLYCDSEAPDRIAEISDAGFYAVPAHKGKGSVKDGIDFLKCLKIHTRPENVNLNKERSSYCWKTDNRGNVLDEPVKHHDHGIDAVRYSIYTHLRQRDEVSIVVL